VRWGFSALAVVLVAGGLSPVAASPAQSEGDPVDWWDDLTDDPAESPEAPPVEPEVSAPLEQDQEGDVPDVALPEPGVAQVSLGDEGDAARVASEPIEVAAASEEVAGADLQVEVLDREVTEPAGVSAFAMRVSGGGGDSLAAVADAVEADELPVEMRVDTAEWADLYGANYPSRIVVKALPDCAIEDPAPAGCDINGTFVPSHLDAETGEIVIEIDDLSALDSATLEPDEESAGVGRQVDDISGVEAVPHETAPVPSGDDSEAAASRTSSIQGLQAPAAAAVAGGGSGSAVLALTSVTSGQEGNWSATPLNLSGDWLVGVGSGEFSWSYDIPVPAAPGGATPQVGLSYSSGSIDGLVTGRNVQAGQAGLGWSDFASAFIERRYAPCDEGEVYHDMCWRSHNATISLNGRQTELVPVSGTLDAWESWVLKDDPNWKVQRRSDFVANGDNNGENWRVTTPDGTEYWFGYGADPSGDPTNSAYTVPVFGKNSGEPCSTDPNAWCNQAWRWNLDRVVDPDGNVTVYRYFKETNKYGMLNGWADASYNNGGRLAWIEYGLREDDTSVPAAGKVEFQGGYRCNHLDGDNGSNPCPVPTASNGNYYKDVPNEFICTSGCLVVAPTFFSTKRYTEVWTYMRVPGQGYPAVDVVRLNHSLADNDEGDKNLWLRSIQRIGKVGLGSSGLALPPVTFHGNALHNRVDYDLSAGKTPMEQVRVDGVYEEYGRNIKVTYGRPNGCTPGTNPHPDGIWHANELSCFPQSWRAPGATANEIAVFHKWLVTQVEVEDVTGDSDSIFTTYDYGPTPAWHHNDDEFLDIHKKTWSDWRGYNTTRVTTGSGSTRSTTRYRTFRGMDGDRMLPIPGTNFKDVVIKSLDETRTFDDNEWLKGRILDEWHIDSTTAENPLTRTLTEYVWDKTSDWGGENQDDAFFVAPSIVTNSTRKRDGTYAHTRTTTTYNMASNPSGTPYVANYQPRTVLEEGYTGSTGDERCTRTSYVNNAALGIYGLPQSQAVVSGSDCGATAATAVLRRQQWHYDTLGLGVAPTKGHVTATRQLVSGTDTWLGYTLTSYDTLGRPTSVTDPNNHTTSTDYVPDVGNLTSTVVENAEEHQSTTTFQVERGLPKTQVDPNGKTTRLNYDGLGRLEEVFRPTETGSDPASMVFAYDIDPDKEAPPVVRTRLLANDAPTTYQDSWIVYDGLLRQRQTHALSPDSTKTIVQSTWYDDQGRTRASALPEAVPGTAGSGILAPANDKLWANQTRPVYDELGRVVEDRFYGVNGDSTVLVERWSTTTSYEYNATWVTPPTGGPTRTVADAYGNVTSVGEGSVSAPWTPLNFHTTSYGYNLAGELTTVTDPGGHVITYTYDKAGRRTSQDDPDAGDWTYTYDDAGNQRTVTDALSHTITTDYDDINRPVLRHEGTTNLASWAYDAVGELGLLDRSTRITTGGNWVTDITGYDLRNRPTGKTLTVPAGITGLSGTYTTSYGYNLADQATTIGYPAVGGLSAETVTTSYYETLGLPSGLSGADAYVGTQGYDNRGRPSLSSYGIVSSQPTIGRAVLYNADQRVESVINAAGGVEATRHDIAYDAIGNITERTTKLGTNNFRECFTYDAYQRLTRAVTTTTSTACSTNPPHPTGSLPYEQDFVHSDDGNLQSRDDGTGAIPYAYPTGTTAARPHAPTSVGTSTYSWDANGNLDTRTVGAVTTDFTFDNEHNLASVSSPSGTSSYVYDADGQRLYQSTPTGKTIYLDGQELNATTGGTPTVTATRLYTFNGQLVATRTAAAGVDYLVADHQGSIEAKADSGGTVVTALRAYKPYGQPRTTDTFATQRGWIGQVEDPTTSLNYLNARYYDANLARFVSPDPLYDPGQPKSINPFTYAWANPITGTDPSGLSNIVDNGSSPETCVNCSPEYLHDHHDTHHDGGGCGSCNHKSKGADVLADLLRANSDPNFWRAVAAAGSGQALVLIGLSMVNSDPGFWAALADIGGAALKAIGERLLQTFADAKENSDARILHWGRGGSVVEGESSAGGANIPGPGCYADDDYCEEVANRPSCRDVGVVPAGHGWASAEPCNWTPNVPSWLCKTFGLLGVGEAAGAIVEKGLEDPKNLPGAVAREAPSIVKIIANPYVALGTSLLGVANC
jgi:RHS repeat-associated protein